MRFCTYAAVAGLLSAPQAAPAQAEPPTKRATIGVFQWHASPIDAATLKGIKIGLRDGKVDAELVERQARARPELAIRQLKEMAADPQCRLIVALGTRATMMARRYAPEIPTVFAAVTNPVTAGIVADWQTGDPMLRGASSWVAPDQVLDVFRLAVPELRDLGVLRSRKSGVVSAAELAGMRRYLRSDGAPKVRVHEAVIDDDEDLKTAVADLLQRGVDAIWIPIDLNVYRNVAKIEVALADRPVPLVTTAASAVADGAVVGAAVDYELHGRRAAALIQRTLQSDRSPTRWPIDRMRSSRVIVNLDAARRKGIELPLSLLVLADELLKQDQ